MEIEITKQIKCNVKYLMVDAYIRYWGDAKLECEETQDDGSNVPCSNGDMWQPIIEIDSGKIIDWPVGVSASFHFKVVDNGSYYLLDDNKNVVSSIENDYVPSGLCHGDDGYGDYIIFTVDENGSILDYKNKVRVDDWSDCE